MAAGGGNSIAAGFGAEGGATGTISLPLLGHHHVVERRRRELLLERSSHPTRRVDDTTVGGMPAATADRPPLFEDFDELDGGLYDRIPRIDDGGGNGGNNLRHRNLVEPNDGHARQLQQQQQIGALYQGYGTHYVDLWVGYPPQRQTLVVDTGSSVTTFPCSGCKSCGSHADPPFDEGASGSFTATRCGGAGGGGGGGGKARPVQCVFGRCDVEGMCALEHNFGVSDSGGGGDGNNGGSGGGGGGGGSGPGVPSSWTAYEASDVVYAGGPHDRPLDHEREGGDVSGLGELNPVRAVEFTFVLSFGCLTDVTGYFERQLASGVMGLDRRAQSFWGQMRASQVIHKAQFSLCFVKQPIASMSGSTAGAVTLGGVDRRLHLTSMVYAKSVGDGSSASFKVRLRKMYLRAGGGQSVMYDAGAAYHLLDVSEESLNGMEMYNIDSGTTDTYLIQSLSDEFRKVWKDVTGTEYTNEPVKIGSEAELRRLPTIIMQMYPHNGGIGDEVDEGDPRNVPGLAGNVDMRTPNDVMLAVPPKHYMQRNARDGTYTSRVYLDRANELGNVLGANAMMGHDVLFDVDESR